MKTVQTSELIGPALDYAVGIALNLPAPYWNGNHCAAFSTDWAQGGPILEREKIETVYRITDPTGAGYWQATNLFTDTYGYTGPSPLIAAMRCFVASKLGNAVEVPEELLS